MVNPECLVSMLFCEAMHKDEAILITGAERFSSYAGYGGGFTHCGSFVDPNPVDSRGRCVVSIVAIDAIPAAWLPGGAHYQFKDEAILRELGKAFCGFSFEVTGDSVADGRVPLATGNWGCGAFGGNKELKTLVQWMATSQAGRDITYYTFRDRKLGERQEEVVGKCLEAKITVGRLFGILTEKEMWPKIREMGAFDYVLSKVSEHD